MEFIPVQSFSNYVEAHIAMGYLQEQHINCWLKDEYTVTIDPLLTNAIGGIKLMVAKAQVPRAIALLKQSAGIKQQYYTCPHCGSHEIQLVAAPQKHRHWLMELIAILIADNAAASKQIWYCLACGLNSKEPVEVPAETMESATNNEH